MVFFDESPAFRLQPEAALKGVKPVAWFDSPTPLRSGWAWGQQYLDQAVVDRRGAGRQGPRRAVRPRGHLARAAARHVQAAVQRHLLRQCVDAWPTAHAARPISRRCRKRVCALRAVCGRKAHGRTGRFPARYRIVRRDNSSRCVRTPVCTVDGTPCRPRALNVRAALVRSRTGPICLLVEREDAPRFEICVVRGDEVLRQNRLYARGSAQMLAETWRTNLAPTALDPHDCPPIKARGTSSGDGMKL